MMKESKATGIKNWPEDDRPREKLILARSWDEKEKHKR